MSEMLFRPVAAEVFQISGAKILLYIVEDRIVVECDAAVGRLFAACRGLRTLDSHADYLTFGNPSGDRGAILHALTGLVEAGLLRSMPVLDRPVKLGAIEGTEIGAIGMITADRPASLSRSLRAVLDNCQQNNRNPEIIVVDGSRSANNRRQNETIVKRLASECGPPAVSIYDHLNIEHVLQTRLAPEMVKEFAWALRPGEAGANRNILMLLTAGRSVLFVDDDIICETWSTPGANRDFTSFCGHSDIGDIAFFDTRTQALDALPWVRADLLRLHETVLGLPLNALWARSTDTADFSSSCAHMTEQVMSGGTGKVRVTFTGLAGDSGMASPHPLLLGAERWRSAMATDHQVFLRSQRSREIRRHSRCYLVTHDPSCMAGCMGFDNRQMSVPFSPIGHNEDGLFGVMLGSCYSDALFAHIPYGVVHDSHRDSAYMPIIPQYRVTDILSGLIHTYAKVAAVGDPRTRLARIGEWLIDIASRPLQDVERLTTRVLLNARQKELVLIDSLVSQRSNYPPFWKEALIEYRDTLLAQLAEADFIVPIEFSSGEPSGLAKLQEYLLSFGRLSLVWPDIWEHAAKTVGLGVRY